MNEYETIADIIAEMRRGTRLPGFWSSCDLNKILQYHADRLEAARKRERGDCAKLREAVGYILKYADSVACRDHDEHTRHYIDQIRKWAQSALAAPPQNCDRPECATTKAASDVWRKEDGGKTAYHAWLLASATDQEGGSDGRQ